MCSFGKDSMVLLHLCRSMDFKWPVLFHREPFMPHKYRFANQIIDDWNLTVYDYRPSAVSIMKKGHTMEIVNEYQIGTQTCVVPTGICSIEGEKEFICGLEDLLCKPTGNI
jgi:3'-phosphoadenosine 5'-phosphosulfate sulfotransferase (PAPS reductase)/FAD synthetase